MPSLVTASEVTTMLLDDVEDSEVTRELVSVLACSDVSLDVTVVVPPGVLLSPVLTALVV